MTNRLKDRIKQNTTYLENSIRKTDSMHDLLNDRIDDIDKVRSKQRALISKAINDNGVLSSVIFIHGTAFTAGVSTIFCRGMITL